jgi:integrase
MRVRKFQDRRSGIWHLKWWEGKQRKFESTGLVDKPLAELKRSAKERELVLAESADTIQKAVEKIVHAQVELATKAALARLTGGPSPSSASAVAEGDFGVSAETARLEFTNFLLNTQRRTRDYVLDVGRQVTKFLSHPFENLPKIEWLNEISPMHVSQYLGSLSGCADKTALNKLGAISGWLTWAVDIAEYLVRNPAEKIKGPALAPLDVRVLTANDAVKILEHLETLKDPRPAAWMATAIYAGLRRGEFRHAQVDLVGRTIRVANTHKKAVKTKKRSRTIPIFDELVPYLVRLRRPDDNFFGINKDLRHMSKRVKDLCADSGVSDAGLQVGRHSYCVHLRLNRVGEFVSCEWSGHSSEVFREYYDGYLTGMQPLPMHWHGHKLESHGLPEVSEAARQKAAK